MKYILILILLSSCNFGSQTDEVGQKKLNTINIQHVGESILDYYDIFITTKDDSSCNSQTFNCCWIVESDDINTLANFFQESSVAANDTDYYKVTFEYDEHKTEIFKITKLDLKSSLKIIYADESYDMNAETNRCINRALERVWSEPRL